MNLSIIIPVYNSSKILDKLAYEINFFLTNELKDQYEIIFINDSSSDNSWKVVKELSRKFSFIKGVNLEKNIGQHGAIFVGLQFSKGKKIIIMDDDLQHPPGSLISIYNKLDDFDACYTLYLKRKHVYWKILISMTNNYFSSFLFNKPNNIYLSSLKGIRGNIKDEIISKRPKIPFIDSLILKQTMNITNIKVNHQERFEGGSNYNLKKLFILWFDMIENYHFYPFRFGSLIGLIAYLFVKLIRLFNKNRINPIVKDKTF
tara:strand:+ start:1041 stop:1820 length:780 start_codon:yes stop_codon:yes gene_type:complete